RYRPQEQQGQPGRPGLTKRLPSGCVACPARSPFSRYADAVNIRDPPGRSSRGNVLSIRPFRRLWIATSLSSLGDLLCLLALTTLAPTPAKRGAAQGAAVGGVWLTSLLPALLLGPLAGAVADRLDRRINMIIGDVFR